MADIDAIEGAVTASGRTLGEWVPTLVATIVKEFDPSRVILYGSVARGDHGPHSDIDLMVVMDSIDYADRLPIQAAVRRVMPRMVPIDIRVTDERECRRRRDVIGSMHYWPLREGRVVYERTS